MKVVVFAAGKGERLWPLTERRPKPLLPVAGRPIIEGTLKALVEAGIREIAIVTSHKEEKMREFVRDGRHLGFQASFVHQESPMGTADALRTCRRWLRGESRFAVVYGDDYYSAEGIVRFVKAARRSRNAAIGVADSDDPSKFGSVGIRKGFVVSIKEKIGGDGPGPVNAGLYVLSDSFFEAVEKTQRSERGEYELTDTVNQMIGAGTKFQALSIAKNDWFGVSYPWDLLEANRLLLESNALSSLQGKVEQGVRITGPLRLGKGSIVKSGCYVEGPVIVGEGSTIGPNSYLRPFTSIGRDCKVGAGCEVKASILMDNVRVPHLSYVGDSIVGEGSSLGAGTITANFRFDESDISSEVKGKQVNTHRRKLGAIIGDEVRTGVNVSIFPGVKIGAQARIWPGMIVGKDVSSGQRITRNILRPSKH